MIFEYIIQNIQLPTYECEWLYQSSKKYEGLSGSDGHRCYFCSSTSITTAHTLKKILKILKGLKKNSILE